MRRKNKNATPVGESGSIGDGSTHQPQVKTNAPLNADAFYKALVLSCKLHRLTGVVKGIGFLTVAEINNPGLVLAGFTSCFEHTQLQLIGPTEWAYLQTLSTGRRLQAWNNVLVPGVPLIVFTTGIKPDAGVVAAARRAHIPLYTSELSSHHFRRHATAFLEAYFAPRITVHGSLMDVFGVGLLYVGKSGIGKSECALDLIYRGHGFVADDAVTIVKRDKALVGIGHAELGHHMEVRGIGIMNIPALFGIKSIRAEKQIDAQIELHEQESGYNYERCGLTRRTVTVLDQKIPAFTIPASSGKNVAVLSEAIALNLLLTRQGINAAEEFNQKLICILRGKKPRNVLTLHGKGIVS